jgi:hypothetical protein
MTRRNVVRPRVNKIILVTPSHFTPRRIDLASPASFTAFLRGNLDSDYGRRNNVVMMCFIPFNTPSFQLQAHQQDARICIVVFALVHITYRYIPYTYFTKTRSSKRILLPAINLNCDLTQVEPSSPLFRPLLDTPKPYVSNSPG